MTLDLASVKLLHGMARTPLTVRSYTTKQIGGNRSHADRNVDGPDALRLGVYRAPEPGLLGVSTLADDTEREQMAARELWSLRHHAERHDEWYVAMMLDFAYARARDTNTMLRDCDRTYCRTTSHVTEDNERCPVCRQTYLSEED